MLAAMPSCSNNNSADDDDGSGSGATGGTGVSLTDTDGDGVPEDLEGATAPVTEDEIEAMRGEACAGWSAEPEPQGATLMMVVDASSSMNDAPPEGGSQSKWEVTRDALIEAVAMLSDDTQLAMLAYPNKRVEGRSGDSSMCVAVDQMVGLEELGVNGHRQTVIDALNAVQTNRCTPTHDAYASAVAEFSTAQATGQKYILLMTDGQPTLTLGCEPGNCSANMENGEQPVIDAISDAWTTHSIKTFVLGSPGSEVHSATGLDNRWWLSQAAEAGQTAKDVCSHDAEPYCHFDMTTGENFAEELRDALVAIVGQVVSCDYSLPAPPGGQTLDLSAINMILRPTNSAPLLIGRSSDPECEQGWYLDLASESVRLCSATCEAIQSDAGASAELLFGCDSIEDVEIR